MPFMSGFCPIQFRLYSLRLKSVDGILDCGAFLAAKCEARAIVTPTLASDGLQFLYLSNTSSDVDML